MKNTKIEKAIKQIDEYIKLYDGDLKFINGDLGFIGKISAKRITELYIIRILEELNHIKNILK